MPKTERKKITIIIPRPKPTILRPVFRTPRMDVYWVRKAGCDETIYLAFAERPRALIDTDPPRPAVTPIFDAPLPVTMGEGHMDDDGYWWLSAIYTRDDCRGAGYAQELIRGLERHLRCPVAFVAGWNSYGLMEALGKRDGDEDGDAPYEWACDPKPLLRRNEDEDDNEA